MACEASRRAREGSPLIPGLNCAIFLPFFFCSLPLAIAAGVTVAICGESCEKRSLSPVHNGCARSRCVESA